MKLHQLVELMQLDGSADPSRECPNAIRNKLNQIKLTLNDVAEAKC